MEHNSATPLNGGHVGAGTNNSSNNNSPVMSPPSSPAILPSNDALKPEHRGLDLPKKRGRRPTDAPTTETARELDLLFQPPVKRPGAR